MNYEISLVPDVKAELLKKQKLRNLVILICIVISISCGAVLALMGAFTGVQALNIASLNNEAACRTAGVGGDVKTCDKKFGTAILKFENYEELLTIQSQLNSVATLNGNKIKMSRLFPILDILLPTGEYETRVSELNADLNEGVISFDAQGFARNEIGYAALEAFRKNSEKIFFDYGNYMRKDRDGDGYVEIPSFCIVREVMLSDGNVYGVYDKGAPGCESDLVEKQKETKDDENKKEEGESEAEVAETEDKPKSEEIYILRTYKSEEDRNKFMLKGKKMIDLGVNSGENKGYYFESKCISYKSGDKGGVDEEASLETCGLLTDKPNIGDSAFGKDADGKPVLSFNASLNINMEVFKASNKHVRVIGPSRQNVTDSYVQIRNMFTEKATEEETR